MEFFSRFEKSLAIRHISQVPLWIKLWTMWITPLPVLEKHVSVKNYVNLLTKNSQKLCITGKHTCTQAVDHNTFRYTVPSAFLRSTGAFLVLREVPRRGGGIDAVGRNGFAQGFHFSKCLPPERAEPVPYGEKRCFVSCIEMHPKTFPFPCHIKGSVLHTIDTFLKRENVYLHQRQYKTHHGTPVRGRAAQGSDCRMQLVMHCQRRVSADLSGLADRQLLMRHLAHPFRNCFRQPP